MAAVAAGGQDGPTFTGPFQDEYQGFELIEASGMGCPATGGAPSETPPGVFVSVDGIDNPSLAVEFEVAENKVVYTPDTFYPEAQGVYAPLDADGSWSLQIEAEFGSPPRYELEAFCTTLIELTDDGRRSIPSRSSGHASVRRRSCSSPHRCRGHRIRPRRPLRPRRRQRLRRRPRPQPLLAPPRRRPASPGD